MKKDAKRILPGVKRQVSIIKGYIRESKRPFFGDALVRRAVSELRKEGLTIDYIRATGDYVVRR